MARRNILDELRSLGAEVECHEDSTRFTDRYRVRMPGRPEMRLTNQYIGGWSVTCGGRTFATCSVPMTIALVAGRPLNPDLMTPSQRRAYLEVVEAGESGLETSQLVHRQLATLGFVSKIAKGRWCGAAVEELPNPVT